MIHIYIYLHYYKIFILYIYYTRSIYIYIYIYIYTFEGTVYKERRRNEENKHHSLSCLRGQNGAV